MFIFWGLHMISLSKHDIAEMGTSRHGGIEVDTAERERKHREAEEKTMSGRIGWALVDHQRKYRQSAQAIYVGRKEWQALWSNPGCALQISFSETGTTYNGIELVLVNKETYFRVA